jgi:hypothetical protein
LPLDYIEEGMLGQVPTEGRILIEEYYKVLYLNNEDPEKYNFAYWEKYFGVSKQTLRNIFNYIFFPIPDPNKPSEIGKVLYFQDAEYAKRRMLISKMSGEEYKEYLSNTEERPELQEPNRFDYLEFQTTSTEPRISDRTVMTDYDLEDRMCDEGLKNSDIIKQIDEQITKLVQEQLENPSNNLIDKDVQLQIEQLNQKRIVYEKQKLIEGEKEKLPPMTKEQFKEKIGEVFKIVASEIVENNSKEENEKKSEN